MLAIIVSPDEDLQSEVEMSVNKYVISVVEKVNN